MKRLTLILILFLFCNFTASKRGQILCNINNQKVAIFVNSVWNIAEEIEIIYGIPLELTIAQAAQESGFGTSNLALNECNYFGIKGYKFASREECFLKYADILTALPCYTNLQPKTLEDWFKALECCGYAGDTQYTKRLKRIIDNYLTLRP